MAKARNGRSVDEDEVEEVPPSEAEKSGDEEGEEYEIETILDAKQGTFEGGKLGYLVKWKGYPESSNSWVSEDDAINCQDLIDNYWSRQNKKGEKPGPKKPASTSAAPRKSESLSSTAKPSTNAAIRKRATPEDEPEPISAPPKKRGRPPKQKVVAESEDDVPATKAPVKRGRPSSQAAKKVKDSDAMDEDEGERYGDMTKYKDLISWEHLIEHIDTVERRDDGKLIVYFKLNKKSGGTMCAEETKVCREKLPNLLFDFYEHNLRWRPYEARE